MTTTPPPDAFDAALRRTWHAAAAQVPGPLRLQLSPAIAAQRASASHRAKHRWVPTAGALASVALAVTLWWSTGFDANPAQVAPPAQMATDAAATPADEGAAADLLIRNPDFYAWLGTEEARQLAME